MPSSCWMASVKQLSANPHFEPGVLNVLWKSTNNQSLAVRSAIKGKLESISQHIGESPIIAFGGSEGAFPGKGVNDAKVTKW